MSVNPGDNSRDSSNSGVTPRDLDLELQRQTVHARLFGVELPALKLGRFTLVRRIGAGGMGVVYAARDDKLGREVALKLLHPQLGGPEATTRLVREARAMARLSHPNVVQLYDVGEHGGRVFVTMEFIRGETLRVWQQQPRGWRTIVEMYIQAGEGLAAAHHAGLVHRDFKPENALVAADGRLRVLDFGLASMRLIEEQTPAQEEYSRESQHVSTPSNDKLTITGMDVGTPGYTAPELRGGGQATPHADQYSFCVALYESLHGVRPDQERDTRSMRRDIGFAGAAPHVEQRIPSRIRAVVARGLASDPQERWPSMRALLDALIVNSQTRRRWVVLVGVAAVILCLAGLMYVQYERELAQTQTLLRSERERLSLAQTQKQTAAAEAKRDAARAESSRLASLARTRGADDTALGLLLAVESVVASTKFSESPLPEAEQALRDALGGIRSTPVVGDGVPLTHVAVAAMGQQVVTARRDGRLAWTSEGTTRALRAERTKADVTGVAVSERELVAATFADGWLALWDMSDRESIGSAQLVPRSWVKIDTVSNTASAPIYDPVLLTENAEGPVRVVVRGLKRAALVHLGRESHDVTYLGGHTGNIRIVRISPDQRFFATAGSDGIRLWNAQGEPLHHLKPRKGTGDIRDLDFSRDSTQLLSASIDGTVRMWRVRDGRSRIVAQHPSPLRLARFTSETSVFATVTTQHLVRTWELDRQTFRALPPAKLTSLEQAIGRLEHVPQHNMIVGTPPGGVAFVWSLSEPAAPVVLRGHTGSVVEAVFDGGGNVLATASTDGTARVWQLYTQQDVLRGHSLAVTQIAYLADGTHLLSAGMDGTARLWALDNIGESRSVALTEQREDAGVVADVREDGCIITVSMAGHFSLWAEDGHARIADGQIADEPTDVAVGPNGLLAVGTRGGVVDLRRLDEGGREREQWRLDASAPVTSVAFAAGKFLLAATAEGSVQVWEISAGTPIQGLSARGHRGAIYDLAVAPSGEIFATAGEDGNARIWSFNQVDSVVLQGHEGPVWSVGFDNEGRHLLTASSDTTVRVWNPNRPEAATQVLRGHSAAVWSAEFSPDGTKVVTSSGDGTARLWTLGTNTSVLLPHTGTAPPGDHHRDVTAAVFNREGTEVATSAADGVVRLFAVGHQDLLKDACARAGRALTQDEWKLAFGEQTYEPFCR